MFRCIRVIVFLVACRMASSQSQTTAPSFEAAAVKVNQSGEIRMAVDFQAGGRFSATNVPLKILIALAYHVRPDAVSGGPPWLASSRFDIVAKASQAAPQDELRRMLQGLLAERFKLELHADRKLAPAYAMVPAKGGPRLQPSETALLTDQRCRPGEAVTGQKHVVCEHMTLAFFADALQELAPRDLDVPVVDQTGIEGTFTFNLTWSPAARSTTVNPDPAGGPTLFEAMEAQLGLKLEGKKLPLPVMIVDRAEPMPVENRL